MIRLALAAFMIATPAIASEDEWNRYICEQLGGIAEVRTGAGTDIDCLTTTTAWEADFSGKWAEAIGQALHYAAEERKRPGVIFLCKESDELCLRHELRMISTIGAWFDLRDWDFLIVNARGDAP